MNFLTEIYSNIRAALRFIKFVWVIFLYFVNAIIQYYSTNDSIERRRRLTANGSRTARAMVNAFNIELICKNNIPEDESSLLVGNHIGCSDIVCLVALRSGVFITSLEMKNTPVLGQIADLGGCAYVNRKNRMSIQDELKGIVDVLKQGFRVVLYAESVASNGEQVLPFKKTLMMSAGLADKPIRPFVFNFVKVNGGPVKYEQRDSVCWYGDETFFPAIWRSLKLDSVACEIEFLPLVHPEPNEDRTTLANRVHAMVSASYRPFYPDMNAQSDTQSANPVSTY
jgi:1-acyl-sn-glycerol-3-phosphate acyltransferase